MDERRFMIYWDEFYLGGPITDILTPADDDLKVADDTKLVDMPM